MYIIMYIYLGGFNMIEAISITEARNSFLSIVKSVKENFKKYILTKHGKPEVIILNYQEYCRMKETLDLVSNKEELKKQVIF